MRVLIADGDEASLEILQSYLWERGYEVEIAGNGLECIAILREFLPDVLLLEQGLLWGGSDGVIAQMRDDPTVAETPIILMAKEDLIDGLDSEVQPQIVGCLWKPFRLVELLGQLTHASQNVQLSNLAMGAM